MTTRADLIDTAARALAPWDGLAPNVRRAQAIAVLDAVLPQITTVEELEALPVGARVMSTDQPQLGEVLPSGRVLFGVIHYRAEDALRYGPLTVVWQPQPEQETRADA